MRTALREHYPEYLMEAAELGLFMLSACLFGTLLAHPASPLRIADAALGRVVMGLAMGATCVAIFYSPWGKQSGAHLNPAVTLSFLRLGKLKPIDAAFYVAAQFGGGLAGVLLSVALLGKALSHPSVNYVATLPGAAGAAVAALAELVIAFVMMSMVLATAGHPRLGRFTGFFAACLVALYISIESPLSGMSLNPARSLASALPGGVFSALWVYLVAPPLGMLAAAELFRLRTSTRDAPCAKLHHENRKRCIFCGARMQAA